MKTTNLSFVIVLTVVSAVAQAKVDMNRGGVGFLYQDFNGITNPGHFAKPRTYAAEGSYVRGGSSLTTYGMSLGLGMGQFGFGAFGNMYSSVAGGNTLSAGGAVGIDVVKDRFNVGASFVKGLSSSSSSLAAASMVVTPSGMSGVALGFGATTTLGTVTATRNVTAALGVGSRSGLSGEVNATAHTLSDLSNIEAAGFVNWSNNSIYLGTGFNYYLSSKSHLVEARVGFIFPRLDFSFFGSTSFSSGSSMTYGTAVRSTF